MLIKNAHYFGYLAHQKVQLSTFPRGLNCAQKPQSSLLFLKCTFQPFSMLISHSSCLFGLFFRLSLGVGKYLVDRYCILNWYPFA